MPLYRTEAIVVGGWDLGEADRIISFFTRRMGGIRGVAPGARRGRSRFGGRLQLLTHGTLVCFAKENWSLYRINEFEPIDSFQTLRFDLDRLSHACYLVELVSLLVLEGEISEEVFLLLLRSLRRLEESGIDLFHAEKAFEAGILRVAGYFPELEQCMKCKGSLDGESQAFFSAQEGGVLCPKCHDWHHSSCLPLTPSSLAYLLEAKKGHFRNLLTTSLSEERRGEISQAMRSHIALILRKNLSTLQFMEQLRKSTWGMEMV